MKKMEDDLNLKQLQIKSLLSITQAINNNISAAGLFNMYQSFLSWEMGVTKMALFILKKDQWHCVSKIEWDDCRENELIEAVNGLNIERIYTVRPNDPPIIKEVELIISVKHKEQPIAYALIGGVKTTDDIYNKVQFITTITNIIAVAIENKRLFKEQLEQEGISREMKLASEVQKMLIPKSLPQNELFALSSIYQPFSGIGGDYFDYIPFSKERFTICIGDISGKGVSAAILMANIQAIVQNLIHHYRDLPTFIIALNEAVLRITEGEKYITFFIADINVKTNEMKYVNAGHFPPILYKNGEIIRLETGCTIIGSFEDIGDVQEGTITLESDSILLTFTDGIVDIKDEKGVFINEIEIEEFVRENSNLDIDAFNQKLKDNLMDYKGMNEFTDDIAILALKYFGFEKKK